MTCEKCDKWRLAAIASATANAAYEEVLEPAYKNLVEACKAWATNLADHEPCGGCGECSTCTLVAMVEDAK